MRFSFLFIFAASLSGCSLGLFSDGKDQAVLKQKSYRKVNPACAQLDLGGQGGQGGQGAGLSVGQVRGVLACLNSNGALAEFESLARSMSDGELAPLVQVANEQLLVHPTFLAHFRATYSQWQDSGQIEGDLEALGGLMGDERWWLAAISLLENADPKFYRALEVMFKGLEPSKLAGGLHAWISLVESPAMSSLLQKLRASADGLQTRGQAASHLLNFLRVVREPGRVDLDRRILAEIASGRLFQVMDDFSRTLSPNADIKLAVSRLSGFFGQLVREEGRGGGTLLSHLLQFFNGLRQPIRCMRQTQTMPDPVLFALQELGARPYLDAERFLRRDNVLDVALMNSFCDYPDPLVQHYPAFQQVVSTDSVFTLAAFSNAFTHRGAAGWLADAVSGESASASLSPLMQLVPLFSGLERRGALADFLLVLASFHPKDRGAIQALVTAWVEPRAELEGASIHDAFRETLARCDSSVIEGVLGGIESLLEAGPSFRVLRHVYLINGAHPVVERIRAIMIAMGTGQKSRDFFAALGQVARRHPRQLSEAIAQLRVMSRQTDGRLRDLMDAGLRIFARFSERSSPGLSAEGLLRPQIVPALGQDFLAAQRAHSLSSADLEVVQPRALPAWNGCDVLTPWVRLDVYDAPGHEELVRAYLDCLGSSGDSLVALTGLRLSNGRPVIHQMIDSLRDFRSDSAFVDRAFRIMFDGKGVARTSALLDAAAPWLAMELKLKGQSRTGRTWIASVFEALSRTWGDARSAFRAVEPWIARVLRGELLPGVVKRAWTAWQARLPITSFRDTESFALAPFQDVLKRFECIRDPGAMRIRADELIEDYRKAVVGWRLDPRTGRPPRQWDTAHLKNELEPLLEMLVKPGKGFLAEGLGQFMRLQGSGADLTQWISLRANDWRVIPYFYPEETVPRAKLVNSMDLLELLLINANFSFVFPENFALKFLTKTALAWGDEPRERWPSMIRELHPGRSRPQTLAEAYEDILGTLEASEKWIGYPKMPSCSDEPDQSGVFPHWVEARVFNMRQAVAVIREGLPGAAGPKAGGLRILRDLLFQMYLATPPQFRSHVSGWDNNLYAGVRLAELGAFRQISRGARLALLPVNQVEAEGARLLSGVTEGLVALAGGSSGGRLIRAASSRELVFSLIDGAQSVLADPEAAAQLSELGLYGASLLRSNELGEEVAHVLAAILEDAGPQMIQLARGAAGLLVTDPRLGDSLRGWIRALEREGAGPEFPALMATFPVTPMIEMLGAALRPGAREAWGDVVARTRLLLGDGADGREGLLGGEGPDRPGLPQNVIELLTSPELRQYLAGRYERHEPSLFLDAAASDPEGFTRLFESVGKASQRGELQQLIRAFRRALPLTSDGAGPENRGHVQYTPHIPRKH